MLILLLLPAFVVVTILFVVNKTICWREFLLTLFTSFVFAVFGLTLSYCGATADEELLNGSVKSKSKEYVSCSHSYECNCTNHTTCSGTGSSRHCSTTRICQTCYEHFNDWDWVVQTTVGTLNIDRIDRQGSKEPPRWTKVVIGEPATLPHSYTNYIKAAPSSVLTNQQEYRFTLPKYPKVYDYYRANHLILDGVVPADYARSNAILNDLNSRLGSKKQINILYVITKAASQDYMYALRAKWIGGKKNDFIVVLGVPDQKTIQWAGVITWSEVELLKVKVRDSAAGKPIDSLASIILTHGEMIEEEFHRKPMADYEYLKYQYAPSTTSVVLIVLISIVISVLLSIFFINNDVFGQRTYRSKYEYWR